MARDKTKLRGVNNLPKKESVIPESYFDLKKRLNYYLTPGNGK